MSDTMIERVARAIREADIWYNIQLTRLVDGVHTYTAAVGDQPPKDFDCYEDASEYVQRFREVAKARAAVEAMRAWQPIESAPKDGKIVLLGWWNRGNFHVVSGSHYFECWNNISRDEIWPTHWMRLPDPPDAAAGGEG